MFYRVCKFLVNCFISLYYKFEIYGAENIPKNDQCVICANHIHWLDPIIISSKIKRDVYFIGKAELFSNKFFAFILKNINVIPVKRGEGDISTIRKSLRLLKEGEILGIFPEGTRVKDGEIRKPHSGPALISIKSNSQVIPIGIFSDYSFRSKVYIYIGKPISTNKYDKKKVSKEELASFSEAIMFNIREQVKQIKKDIK